jgi:hypothetical protein
VQRHGHRVLVAVVGVGAEALQEAALEQQGELQVGKQHLKSRGWTRLERGEAGHKIIYLLLYFVRSLNLLFANVTSI